MSAVAAVFDDNRRTLWDMFARTIVVLDADVAPDVATMLRSSLLRRKVCADVKWPWPHSSFQTEPFAHRTRPVLAPSRATASTRAGTRSPCAHSRESAFLRATLVSRS